MSVATPIEEGLSEMGEAALAYARHGMWVFPVHTPLGGKCSCRKPDCSNVGKHPRTQHGLSDATTDEDTVRRWWGMWPQANIGISCGPSRIVAIDVDPRHGGEESYRDLVQTHGRALVDTVSALTGGGGEHYLFLMPQGARIGNVSNSDKFTGPLGPGVDVRGAGGYIVAAPSTHESGGKYEWWADNGPFDRPMALLPRPLIDLLDNAAPEAPHPRLDTESILGGVPEGQRDWRLFQLAAKLRAADVPRDWAEQLVTAAAASCIPPFPYADALAKVESAYRRYVPEKAAYADPDSILPEESDDVAWKGASIDWATFWATDYKAEDWLIEPIIPRGRSVSIYSPAKMGKSLFALDIAARAATGGKLFGQNNPPVAVMYIDLEMTEADVQERLLDMGYDGSEDFSHFYYYVLPPIRPLDTSRGGQELVRVAVELGVEVVFIDTTSRVLSMPENDSDTMRAFYMYTGLGLKNAGISLTRLDHAGKDPERGQRGTSAKNDDVDLVWRLMADEDGGVTLRATHRRQSWIPEVVEMHRLDDPLRHEPTAHNWAAGTKEAARILDDLGVPIDWGATKARKAIADAGRPGIRKAVLVDAQQWRRQQTPKIVPDIPGTDISNGESGTSGTAGNGANLNRERPRERSGTVSAANGNVPPSLEGERFPAGNAPEDFSDLYVERRND